MPLLPAGVHDVEDELTDAGALDGDVRLELGVGHRAVVVGGAEGGDQVGLEPVGHLVEHVDLEARAGGRAGRPAGRSARRR